MQSRGGTVHFVEHGEGTPVIVLHGGGVDHREAEACFEPAFARLGLRRIYPDLPGMGCTAAPASVRGAGDVLDILLAFADTVTEGTPYLLAGHSAGGYFAQAMASREPERVRGLALVCPLLADVRDVPEHQAVVDGGDLGDQEFRGYFVMQTPEMLERYERYVVPGMQLADEAAAARIGADWALPAGEPFAGPALVIAGRLDATVGFAAAADLAGTCPRATLAVLDDAGHALPHEQPDLLRALVADWAARAVTHPGAR